MGVPCVFFDRDGIINVSPGPGYVERVEDFRLIPHFFDALQVVCNSGYKAAVITNQRGVGLGIMSDETLTDIHRILLEAVEQKGLELLDIYACTADDDLDPMRKPNPGMLLAAAEDHGIDLTESWMIGDSEKDVEAGRQAGCHTVLVSTTQEPTVAAHTVPDMSCLPDFLRRHLDRKG